MKKVLSILVFTLFAFILVSCSSKNADESKESQFEFDHGVFLYDGNAHEIKCEVPDGYTVEYFGNGPRSVGEHPVVAVVYDEDGNEVEQIKKYIYIFEFAPVEYFADGTPKSVELGGFNEIPSTLSVSYTGNGATEQGEYQVTATISDNTSGKELAKLTTTLTIKKAFTIDDVVFESKTFTYTGGIFTIECSNVPDGIMVVYDGNEQSQVGQYTATAYFYDDDLNLLGEKTATITIVSAGSNEGGNTPAHQHTTCPECGKCTDSDCDGEKCEGHVATPDISAVVFESKSFDYTGAEFSLECTNLPDGVTVNYEGNGQSSIGTHTVVAILLDANNNEIGRLEAILTINQVKPPHTATSQYQLVVNGYDYYDLTSNGKQWVEGVEVDEWMGLGIELKAGDVITLFDSVNNANWAITNVNPWSQGSPFAAADGIVIGETAKYDIYVQFLFENDKIYFGYAGA